MKERKRDFRLKVADIRAAQQSLVNCAPKCSDHHPRVTRWDDDGFVQISCETCHLLAWMPPLTALDLGFKRP